jgi:hypothetical protein
MVERTNLLNLCRNGAIIKVWRRTIGGRRSYWLLAPRERFL